MYKAALVFNRREAQRGVNDTTTPLSKPRCKAWPKFDYLFVCYNTCYIMLSLQQRLQVVIRSKA